MTMNVTISSIEIDPSELDLDRVLMSGQTFRWELGDDGWWVGVVTPGGAALAVKRDGNIVLVQSTQGDPLDLLSEYFRLHLRIGQMRDCWVAGRELKLAADVLAVPGLRLVRQDPVECLFGFLCSSAAPIHRIRRSVGGMCSLLGTRCGDLHGVPLVTFPPLEALASVERHDLDRIGLGFRGRYVREAASEILLRGGRHWLDQMRFQTYDEAKAQLVTLPGIGEKVADCICLFALDKDEAVPIDVHMARVARREFAECASMGAITAKTYALASKSFRDRFGEFAGWAQQYYFYAEIEKRGLWDQNAGRHRPKKRAVTASS